MNREAANKVRFLIEDVIPPVLRDSFAFRGIVKLLWGDHVDRFARFRERAPFLTDEEYVALYRDIPHIHGETDNSEACIQRIIADAEGESLCDVGCGRGVLLKRIRAARPDIGRLTGVDVQLDEIERDEGIDYVEAKIEALPFPDQAFDTVVCTHTLEHVLDIRQALSELRRIARKRLIIVVPREREYRYNFNPHFHFFPYLHSFLRAIHPIPTDHVCEDIKRDIYYRENRA